MRPTERSRAAASSLCGKWFAAAVAWAVLAASTAAGADSGVGPPAQWRVLATIPGIVDVVGPRADGRLVVSTKNGLFLVRLGRAPVPFARGTGGYVAGAGGEPYLAIAATLRVPGAGCSFQGDDVYALDADSTPGVTRVSARGQASRLIDLPAAAFPSGIAFDRVGRFGHRLLVAAVFADKTTIYAIDCRGRAQTITQDAPHLEGGMAVAPLSFGRFGGDLVAPDENSGRIYAVDPLGDVQVVAETGLPAGGDIGVEGLGFVPQRLGRGATAYFSDLGAPGSPTVGTDSLLVLRAQDLARIGLRPGELVAATEAGAVTVVVHCGRACSVREIAVGSAAAHGEGHVTFERGGLQKAKR
jgi:hypothetical protein